MRQCRNLVGLICELNQALLLKPTNIRSIVNNAGISIELDGEGQNPVWETSTEGWDRSFQVNAKGVFLCCKYATGQMIQQNPDPSGCRGRIVNIASAVGLVGARNAGTIQYADRFILHKLICQCHMLLQSTLLSELQEPLLSIVHIMAFSVTQFVQDVRL